MNILSKSKKLEQSNLIRIKRAPVDENSLLTAAARSDYIRMRELLNRAGNKYGENSIVNKPAKISGLTPLMNAALFDDGRAAEILMEYGAASGIYLRVPDTSAILLKGKNALDMACEKSPKNVFKILQKKAVEQSNSFPICIDRKISYNAEVSSENNKILVEYDEDDNNTNTLQTTNRFVMAAATTLPTVVGSVVGAITTTATSDSSMLNRLTNAAVGFNSTVSESTDWSTGAVVGAVSLGALVILSGVGGICYYLSKKTESYKLDSRNKCNMASGISFYGG